MKFIFFYFVPFIIGVSALSLFIKPLNKIVFAKQPHSSTVDLRYVQNFKDNAFFEDKFLQEDSCATLFLLGSSELTGATDATPFNFISDHFKTKVFGVGHAGNQCFSIFSQLLAQESRLENARIIIILSPGWFHSDAARGTTAPLFLEFNSAAYLKSIFQNKAIPEKFRNYESKRVADLYPEILNPDLSTKLLYFEQQSTKSALKKVAYYPLMIIDNKLNDVKFQLLNSEKSNLPKNTKFPIITEPVLIN